MADMPMYVGLKNLAGTFNPFFERTLDDHPDMCNMEELLTETDLPIFSHESLDFMAVKEFDNFHHTTREVSNALIERDKCNIGDSNNDIEVEHTIIDFQQLIISEKIRVLENSEEGDDLKKEANLV